MAIVSRSNHKVRTSEKFASSDFRIEASPEAFRILSDGLYSNKVKAVIRELSTNAVDSLIDADALPSGNNWSGVGYEVHLPTNMEAEFSIRDYGTGLSHEDVIGLYTTYFGTNKTHSNAFTGQLGLGSKSPFAYTDSFNVISWHGGMKRTYNAHISESGYPAISLLHEEKCTNSSGLEVKFPVKQEDIYDFETEAEEVYKYFDVLPKFTGEEIEIEPPEKTLSGEGWYLNQSKHRNSGAIAVMGNIAYPISTFDGSDDRGHNNLLNTGIVLDFEIGDLDITPSREALSMTKRTIANLKSRLDTVIAEVKGEVQNEFNGCENLWEARCLSSELFGTWDSPLYHLGDVCKSADITFEGESIQIDTKISFSDKKGMLLYRFHEHGGWRAKGPSVKRESINDLPCDKDLTFFIDDLSGSGAYARCKEWVESDDNEGECYLVRFWEGTVKNSERVKDKFLEYTGMEESLLLSVSELPKPTRSWSRSGNGTGVRKDKVLLFDPQQANSSNSDYWDSCEVDIDAGGIYVEISRYKVVDSNCPIEFPSKEDYYGGGLGRGCDDLRTIINSFNSASNGEDIKLYGVKSANIKKYKKSEDWVNLWDYIEEYVDTKMQTKYKKLMQHRLNSGVLCDLKFEYEAVIKLCSHLESDIELKVFGKVLSDMKKSADSCEGGTTIYDLSRLVNLTLIKYKGEAEPISNKEYLEKKYEEELEKYPILKIAFANDSSYYRNTFAFQCFNSKDWKIVAEYVEQS